MRQLDKMGREVKRLNRVILMVGGVRGRVQLLGLRGSLKQTGAGLDWAGLLLGVGSASVVAVMHREQLKNLETL